MPNNSDIVLTPAARREQTKRGTAKHYDRKMESGYPDGVTPDLAGFVAELDTAFLATVSADGAPYIQHRGGPKGFIKVLDQRTLAFADFAGNKQYITIGNLAGNDRAYLFLLDFANKQRIKLWGRARVVEGDPALMEKLVEPGYRARPERAILFTIEAWDINCSQHIHRRFSQRQITPVIERLRDADYVDGEVQRAILFTVEAWDINCSQHIHRRLPAREVAGYVEQLQSRIRELETELAAARRDPAAGGAEKR